MNPKKEYYAPMHTAEHILNQTIIRQLGCERSFSNHIERKKSKCDYHFDRDLTEHEKTSIENCVNDIIQKDLQVSIKDFSMDKAQKHFDLKRLPGNSVSAVRIVFIGDYDTCPCIGDHVESTKEIGCFKIVSSTYNNGILRIRYKLHQPGFF